jgi:hypothetical protein
MKHPVLEIKQEADATTAVENQITIFCTISLYLHLIDDERQRNIYSNACCINDESKKKDLFEMNKTENPSSMQARWG